MSNNCSKKHAVIFFFVLSLLVHNHDFLLSPSKPTKPRDGSCSCTCPTSTTTTTVATSLTTTAVRAADPTLTLYLAFLSGVLFTLLCLLPIRFPTLLTAPLRSAATCLRRIKHLRRSPPPPSPTALRQSPTQTGCGISAFLLKTVPKVLVFCGEQRPKFGTGASQCAICLTEFLNEQILRWLPDCDHLFHKGCINTWLQSHTTCPCCRAKVDRLDGEILLLDNGANLGPEMGSLMRLPGGDGGRDLDAGIIRVGCGRSVVSGLLRALMGRRRHHNHRLRHRYTLCG